MISDQVGIRALPRVDLNREGFSAARGLSPPAGSSAQTDDVAYGFLLAALLFARRDRPLGAIDADMQPEAGCRWCYRSDLGA